MSANQGPYRGFTQSAFCNMNVGMTDSVGENQQTVFGWMSVMN
jgi:hypothetical protein